MKRMVKMGLAPGLTIAILFGAVACQLPEGVNEQQMLKNAEEPQLDNGAAVNTQSEGVLNNLWYLHRYFDIL